jgi:hypothetical protein
MRCWPIASMGFPHAATHDIKYSGYAIPKEGRVRPAGRVVVPTRPRGASPPGAVRAREVPGAKERAGDVPGRVWVRQADLPREVLGGRGAVVECGSHVGGL